MPRCWHVRDLPAVAAWVQIDHAQARDHRIEEEKSGELVLLKENDIKNISKIKNIVH